jgi:predicted DNA-binding transcriptional regulator AlpA
MRYDGIFCYRSSCFRNNKSKSQRCSFCRIRNGAMMEANTTETLERPNSGSVPLLYRISTVMRMLDISHSTVYRMVASGELNLVKLSVHASRITSASVTRVLAGRGEKE